jgi:hypothetical protein
VNRHVQLYFFSETGKARNVVKRLKTWATKKNWQAESFNEATIDRSILQTPPANTMIDFVSPTFPISHRHSLAAREYFPHLGYKNQYGSRISRQI